MKKIHDEYELPINRRKRIMDDISMYSDEPFLVSGTITTQSNNNQEDSDTDDVWLSNLSITSKKEIKASRRRGDGLDDLFILKDKKKKKKKKEELMDFNKEFEHEMALYDNMIMDQIKFVKDIQSKYDTFNNAKTTVRGTGKFTTDLITGITQSRSLAETLVTKRVALKSKIMELDMKQKKELGLNVDGTDLNQQASEFLRNIMSKRSDLITSGFNDEVYETDENDMSDIIADTMLGDDDVSDETMKYLVNEKRNVRIVAVVNRNDTDDFYFIAETGDGEYVADYPLPEVNRSTFNESTMMLTDKYGTKYHAVYQEEL